MNKTLEWMYAAECDGGGLSAWKQNGRWMPPYPEVTGYCIPTLFEWGAGDLAVRCADWLLSVQNANGSFNGIDGIPRPFDTSAIIEGLESAFYHTNDMKYITAGADAIRWTRAQISPHGYLMNSPASAAPEIYLLRASAIIENKQELYYWRQRGLFEERRRSHYVAYALEGAMRLDAKDFYMPYLEAAHAANNRLMPFYVDADFRPLFSDFDYCATCQMGILFHKAGMDAHKYFDAVTAVLDSNGGVPQSTTDPKQILWGAKFYLDFARLML